MSEHRGAWGAREDAAGWWQGTVVAADQQAMHHHQQQMLHHHQQQLQQQQQQQQQQHEQHPATTMSSTTGLRYEYSRPPVPSPQSVPPGQWWYMDNNPMGGMQAMPPAQNPPVSQSQTQTQSVHQQQQHQAEAQARQQQAVAEAHRQQVEVQTRLHQIQQQQQHQNHHQQSLHPNHHQDHLQQQQHHFQKAFQHQLNAVQSPKGRMPRAKGDSRPRGRMTAYAFFVQTCREEHKKKHPEENVVFAEFSKKCAERWKTMVDKEKKRFHEMAEKDKKRYDAEMKNYTPPKGEKQRGKKRKQVKDPNAPKRSLSAFFWFCNDERGKVKSQNPEYGVGDIAKELGRRWANAEGEVKSKFEALAEKDKARYEKEMTAYKKKTNLPAAPVPEPEEEEEEEAEDDEDEDE